MDMYPPDYNISDVHPLVKKYIGPLSSEEAAMGLVEATTIVASLAVTQDLGSRNREKERAGMRMLDLATVGLLVEAGIIPLKEPEHVDPR